jgi:AdoMet-dependent heme synthase
MTMNPNGSRLDPNRRPILVFWESTRACGLACRHCRASAIAHPLPGELKAEEAGSFLESLGRFDAPRPVLVATGGDVLERVDLDALLAQAARLKLRVALAPSVTPLLTDGRVAALRRAGIKVMSISLDGATAATHDGVRGVEGHFAATLAALDRLRRHGIMVQVNTVVMRDNVEELAAVVRIVKESGASIWEVFFLVQVGRGNALRELTPAQNEDVCHFLVDASCYGLILRTVEAPFFRRVAASRKELGEVDVAAWYGLGPLYEQLATALRAGLGPATSPMRAHTKGTRDGSGIVFVAHDGEIHPSGFLPVSLGNVKRDDFVRVYREHPLLQRIRAADFGGRCGRCTHRELCGGSRARAYASSGDPLAEDPACAYQPA